jgi:hypothetical protein
MRAISVLQKCLRSSLAPMHALRRHAVLQAVQAAITGRRLTLIDIARSWPGVQWVRAPLKAFDRLLSNRHLHGERESLYADMGRWLLRGPRPVILVDWSDLKADRSWCLLRAAVPVHGMALPVLDMVFAGHENGSPKAEKRFLQRLKAVVPPSMRPIVVTDAGFRSGWFQAVSALGWDWVGRLRGQALLRPVQAAEEEPWVACRALYAQASTRARELPAMHVTRGKRLASRVVLYRKALQGRKHRNYHGKVSSNSTSRQCAARERDPWLLVASPTLDTISASELVAIYRRRMQIEASFRDLKSHRYGLGLKNSLTRSGARLQVLLLIGALAGFASWVAGLAAQADGTARRLWPNHSTRQLYCTVRIGREALTRGWPMTSIDRWIQLLQSLPKNVLEQMTATA